ncbi:hypothetical protein BJX65DRAFT_198317 [Aspergillus insuetus]
MHFLNGIGRQTRARRKSTEEGKNRINSGQCRKVEICAIKGNLMKSLKKSISGNSVSRMEKSDTDWERANNGASSPCRSPSFRGEPFFELGNASLDSRWIPACGASGGMHASGRRWADCVIEGGRWRGNMESHRGALKHLRVLLIIFIYWSRLFCLFLVLIQFHLNFHPLSSLPPLFQTTPIF